MMVMVGVLSEIINSYKWLYEVVIGKTDIVISLSKHGQVPRQGAAISLKVP